MLLPRDTGAFGKAIEFLPLLCDRLGTHAEFVRQLSEAPFVIGYVMCFGLMGVLAAQCFIYFSRFPNDRLCIRLLVVTVLVLEVLFTVLAFHGFWVGVTDNDTDLSSMVAMGIGGQELTPQPLWSFVVLAPLTGVVSSLTHGFFCWRIWAVQKLLVVPVIIMIVSVMQCIVVSYGSVAFGLVPDRSNNQPLPFYIPTWLAGNLFCDLAITVYMTLILLRNKSQFQNTWSMSVELAKLAVETGLITTTAAAIELVLAIASRVTLFHMALFYIISKLYANCLLATLNARLILRNATDKHKSVTVWGTDEPPSQPAGLTQHVGNTVIQVQKEIETDIEFGAYPVMHENGRDLKRA